MQKEYLSIMDEIESQLKEEEDNSLFVYVTGYPTSASIVFIKELMISFRMI